MKNFLRLTMAAAMGITCLAANAALTTLSGAEWPPAGSSGLETVQFNRVAGVAAAASGPTTVAVALGAHEYKTSPLLPNDGVSTFYAPLGSYLAEDRANWSFDWMFNLGACTSCTVELKMDIDPGVGQNWKSFGAAAALGVLKDSWNYRMDFLEALAGATFDPMVSGKYDFEAIIRQDGDSVAVSDITVITGDGPSKTPEPATLALMSFAVIALGITRRRKPGDEHSADGHPSQPALQQ